MARPLQTETANASMDNPTPISSNSIMNAIIFSFFQPHKKTNKKRLHVYLLV
jgi:hypothetical protein